MTIRGTRVVSDLGYSGTVVAGPFEVTHEAGCRVIYVAVHWTGREGSPVDFVDTVSVDELSTARPLADLLSDDEHFGSIENV